MLNDVWEDQIIREERRSVLYLRRMAGISTSCLLPHWQLLPRGMNSLVKRRGGETQTSAGRLR